MNDNSQFSALNSQFLAPARETHPLSRSVPPTGRNKKKSKSKNKRKDKFKMKHKVKYKKKRKPFSLKRERENEAKPLPDPAGTTRRGDPRASRS